VRLFDMAVRVRATRALQGGDIVVYVALAARCVGDLPGLLPILGALGM